MADNNAEQFNAAAAEKPSPFKVAFQWACAIAAPFGCEAPTYGYEQGGRVWDYYSAKWGAKHAPKAG